MKKRQSRSIALTQANRPSPTGNRRTRPSFAAVAVLLGPGGLTVAVPAVASAATTPTLTTAVAPSSPAVDEPYCFTATLSGGLSPTGTITFLDSGGSACSGTAISAGTAVVNGNGTYTSDTAITAGRTDWQEA